MSLNSIKQESLVDFLRNLHKTDLSPEKYNQQIKLFLESKARATGIPLTGSFELTPVCNLDCKMCYVHLDQNAAHFSTDISLDKWKEVISEAHKMGMIYASLTGGECLTYPYFEEIYLYMINLGIEVGILTNGVLLEGRILELFRKYKPRSIKVTLYGSSDDAYERVTGRRVFDRVYRNIMNAAAAGLNVRLTLTPNRFMLGDEEALIEAAKRTGLTYNINSKLFPPRENTGRNKEDMSIDQYIHFYKTNRRLNQKDELISKTIIDYDDLPEIKRIDEEAHGFWCGAGKSSFSMRWDGNIYPCVCIDDVLESIMEQDFSRAWRNLHQKAMDYLVPSECSKCEYNNVCISCVALHKDAEEKGHCNSQVCYRTKKLIEAGLIIKKNNKI